MSPVTVSAAQIDGLLGETPDSPGGALGVLLDGEVAYARGYGAADLERASANGIDTVYNLASTSKQFTAFLVLALAEEGALSLDQDVREHLPELPDFGSGITLRHLLHHTSGLRETYPDLFTLAGWRFTDTMTQADCLRLLQNQRELDFEPGAEHRYANANYVLLAAVVERVTGRRFAEVCRERIFAPLGMTRSVVNDDVGLIIPGRAAGYYGDEGGAWHIIPLVDSVLGSTNVHSSLRDLVPWVRNLATGEVGGRALVEKMTTPGHLGDGTPLGYGGGLQLGEYRGRRVVEHGGQHGGHCSWILWLPDEELAVIALYNFYQWGMRQLPLRVVDLYLGVGEDARPAAPAAAGEVPAAELESRAGTYFNQRQGTVRHLEVRGGKLVYLPYELELTPVAGGRFVFAEEPGSWLEFTDVGMRLHSDAVYEYRRVEMTASGPLEHYAGRYFSPELRVVWWVEHEGGSLSVRRTRETDTPLTHLLGDTFSDDWGAIVGFPLTYTLAFERGPTGEATGFRLSGSGVRSLRFRRER